MADWTTLPNTAVGVGGLPSGATVTALRDNPVAISEGAPGAPRLRGFAAMTFAEYLDIFPFSVGPGTNTLTSGAYDGSFSTTSTQSSSFQSAGIVTITPRATGEFRFSATARGADGLGGGDSQIRLLKNGTQIASVTTSGSNQDLTTDAVAASGDTFEWQVRKSGGTTAFTAQISGITIGIDDTLTTVGLPIKGSEL
jgi:hypothetical protein